MVLARRKTLWEHKSPFYAMAANGEDLVSQLGIYAVSLSDRISRYEREEVGSTPALRAICGVSSVGRAQSLQVWGQRFETVTPHHPYVTDWHSVR